MLTNPLPRREKQIDTLRGIALFLMIASNMAPNLLIPEHPLFERILGSFAAPLFVILSGMMLSLSHLKRKYHFNHFFLRGFLLIGIGCLLDVILYQYNPLVSMDVLYLIGIATILVYPFLFIHPHLRLGLSLFIFFITPLIQQFAGYAPTLSIATIHFSWPNYSHFLNLAVRSWFFEGFFPLFPWMGYVLLGSVFGSFRWTTHETHYMNNLTHVLIGLFLFLIGVFIWITHPGPHYVRFGYSELFYPATYGFILTSLSAFILLAGFIDYSAEKKIYLPFQILGKSSLFIYLIHSILIELLLSKIFEPQSLPLYLLIYLLFLMSLLFAAWQIDKIRPKLRHAPFLLQFVLGA